MDLFPDGGFVRLRSRTREKYVHADEDETRVCLRPLGSTTSMNTVWKVDLRPDVEGGGSRLLLQGAAYGRYLAVAQDRKASSSHRGVRVLQRDYVSPCLEPSFVWTPHRVEASQNCVRLHNDEQRCLRANGNVVTVTADSRNGDETTMMQWRVEAILPSPAPEPIPLLPPAQTPCKEGYCFACGREGSAPLCPRCASRMKTKLLGARKLLKGARRLNQCAQRHRYCLTCQEVFTGSHKEHEEMSILVGFYNQEPVALVSGEEVWSGIFESIETVPHRAIRSYLLYKPDDPRCDICRDIVSPDHLYGVLYPYCCLKCYVARDGEEETSTEKTIVTMDYSNGAIGFCLTCAALITPEGAKMHKAHDWLSVRTGSDGTRPRLLLPDEHPKNKDWNTIKKGSAGNEVLIRDDEAVRCCCGKRLLSAGNSCTLQCLLDAASRERQFFLPRPLLGRQSLP